MARTTAWVRSEAPSLRIMCCTWVLAVPLHQDRSRNNMPKHLIEAEYNHLGREIGREGLGSSRSRC